jgi:hypothetical protein
MHGGDGGAYRIFLADAELPSQSSPCSAPMAAPNTSVNMDSVGPQSRWRRRQARPQRRRRFEWRLHNHLEHHGDGEQQHGAGNCAFSEILLRASYGFAQVAPKSGARRT